jgi:hypothetical protein
MTPALHVLDLAGIDRPVFDLLGHGLLNGTWDPSPKIRPGLVK